MGRLVEPYRPRSQKDGHFEGVGDADRGGGGDGFFDRIVKYIPGEILATYLAIDRTAHADAAKLRKELKDTVQEGVPLPWNSMKRGLQEGVQLPYSLKDVVDYHLPTLVFVVLLLLTPLYFRRIAKAAGPETPWRLHAFVAVLAFVVWAYAIQGGIFALNETYHAKYAAIGVAVFTIVSGFFHPQSVAPADDGAVSRAAVNQLSPIANSVNMPAPKTQVARPVAAPVASNTVDGKARIESAGNGMRSSITGTL